MRIINILKCSPYGMPLVAIAMSLASSIASANMLVYPMSASIGGGKESAAELRIYSKSDTTQYVKAIAKRVIDPATDHEREEASMNSGDDAIVISPAKFALPAGGTRLVRVIPLGVPKKEVLYRVYLQPVAAPSDDDSAAKDDVSGKVDFSLVWAPLVRVLPKTLVPDFHVSKGALANTGNVRIGLIEAGACQSEQDAASCHWTKFDRSVYPDQHFTLEGLHSAPYVRIRYRVGGMAEVQQKIVRTHSADAINAPSANNETLAGHSIVSTNQKD
ncbi:fimbrial protein [Burkholderia territorii]|uniref:cable pilus chaperone CblB n=1 Tax=Burkholderia territorii TaxID=1503055 RepID=UPI0007536881|nr:MULTISPECIES: cable pilus chaperone CblB [Burkholderia cepacia complex]KUZ02479.1 fimbrial protein [Burkholderia territorii]KUZ06203.1 fimbrial protein [Burkholderia territorii]